MSCVATCYEGAAALERAQGYQPQAVIVDIGLPGMNGYQVARRLREILPNATLIALSGWAAEANSNPREAGFDHYMVKPVELGELQRLLQNARGR
jgi:CheY-like chemotaxis protein